MQDNKSLFSVSIIPMHDLRRSRQQAIARLAQAGQEVARKFEEAYPGVKYEITARERLDDSVLVVECVPLWD